MTKQPFNEAVLELLRRAEMAPAAEWDHSAQKATPGRCFQAQIWDSKGNALASVEPTDDEEGATATAAFIAFARNFAEQYKEELRRIAGPVAWQAYSADHWGVPTSNREEKTFGKEKD